MRFMILIFTFSISLSTFADTECKNFYQCLKEGDKAFEKNDFAMAESFYQKACDLGFKVGCTSLEHVQDHQKKMSGDLSFAKKIEAQKTLDLCSETGSDEKECLQKARALRLEGNFKESLRIQRQFCSEGSSQACYEAGVSALKVDDAKSVENAFAAYKCLDSFTDKEDCLEKAKLLRADGFISQAGMIEQKFSDRLPASTAEPAEEKAVVSEEPQPEP